MSLPQLTSPHINSAAANWPMHALSDAMQSYAPLTSTKFPALRQKPLTTGVFAVKGATSIRLSFASLASTPACSECCSGLSPNREPYRLEINSEQMPTRAPSYMARATPHENGTKQTTAAPTVWPQSIRYAAHRHSPKLRTIPRRNLPDNQHHAPSSSPEKRSESSISAGKRNSLSLTVRTVSGRIVAVRNEVCHSAIASYTQWRR